MARCLREAARERPSFEQILDGLEPLLPAHCGSKPGAGIWRLKTVRIVCLFCIMLSF